MLREPGLRRRAKAQLARRLAGQGAQTDSRVLARYGVFGVVWTALAALFAVGMSLRYEHKIVQTADVPQGVVDVVMGTLWLAFFAPVIVVVGRPLLERLRGQG